MVLNVNGTECEINCYDSYAARFDCDVKPEYKGKAEAYLLEALEKEDNLCGQSSIAVYVDSEKTEAGGNEEFVFMNFMSEKSSLSETAVFSYAYTYCYS